jgi:hypothetical protein
MIRAARRKETTRMENDLQQLIDRIHAAATTLENSEFAHLVKADAVSLYHDTANALTQLAATVKELTAIVKPGPASKPEVVVAPV